MKLLEHQKAAASVDFAKLVMLALAAAAGAAFIAALLSHISEHRFRSKMNRCADSIQIALPTLRHAAELTIAEHEPDAMPNQDGLPF